MGCLGKFIMVYFGRRFKRSELVPGRVSLVPYHYRNSCGNAVL